jgi:hypothetical protein
VGRFATPGTRIVSGRGGGASKRLGGTGIASRRGTWGDGRSHSARALLTVRRSAPRSLRTGTPMTSTREEEVAKGVRVRGSRWASGLICGGEVRRTRKRVRQANKPASLHLLASIHHILALHRTVPGTTARSMCKGGAGRARGVLHGMAGAEERASRKKWRGTGGAGGPVALLTSKRMHGRMCAVQE